MEDYLTHLNDYRRNALLSYKGTIVIVDIADVLSIMGRVQEQLGFSINEDDVINTVMVSIENKHNFTRRLQSRIIDSLMTSDTVPDMEWLGADESSLITEMYFAVARNLIGALEILGMYNQSHWLAFQYQCRDTTTNHAIFVTRTAKEFARFIKRVSDEDN